MHRLRHFPAHLALLALLLSASGCGGGGGGGVTTDLGILTAPYLVLDLASGAIDTREVLPDLLTNDAYKSTLMVFRALPGGSGIEGTGASGGGFDLGGQADEPAAATVQVAKCFVAVFE